MRGGADGAILIAGRRAQASCEGDSFFPSELAPMADSPSILFVCSGNIFRSMSAEFALRHRLGSASPIFVSSAGLEQAPHDVMDFVAAHLLRRGLDVSNHRPRRLTDPILTQADLAVAMGYDHRDQIGAEFARPVPLFSEVAYGVSRPLPDVWEVVPDWRANLEAAQSYAEGVIDYIVDAMPDFARRMDRFLAQAG